MTNRSGIIVTCQTVLFLIFLSGCAVSPTAKPFKKIDFSNLNKDALHQKIDATASAADTKEELVTLIELYKLLLNNEIDQRKNLSAIADYYILLGASYTTNRSEKKDLYMAAMAHAEKLMMLNDEFRIRSQHGDAPWDAVDTLAANDADGMGRWSTAALFYFRECIPTYRRIFSMKWVKRSKKMMDRIEHTNPTWMNGANYFNMAIYYHALPAIAGGSTSLSSHYLKEAEKIGGDRSLFSWGKAKYIYTEHGNKILFKESLNKILIKDLTSKQVSDDSIDPYAWRVYFYRDAKNLLSQINSIF